MDEEEIENLGRNRVADMSGLVSSLVMVGFFLVGWCLYKRLKR